MKKKNINFSGQNIYYILYNHGIIMLLRIPYNFPGKVKEIIPQGDASEVILALQGTLEISVLIATSAMTALALKKGVPAYTAIMWMKGAVPPNSLKKMITVQAANGTWVTIPGGPATDTEIGAAREKAITDHSLPSPQLELVWSYGYLQIEDFMKVTQDIMSKDNGCASGSSKFQVETILYPHGTWVTFPYSSECEAKILNVKEQFKNSSQKPSPSLLEAWSHGYSSQEGFSQAPGSPNGFRVDGPTLAGFVCTGNDGRPDLFSSSGSSAGQCTLTVPVNIYLGPRKVGQAQVTNIKP